MNQLQATWKVALPLGVEPRSSVPETNVLSIELQEQTSNLLPKLLLHGQSVKSLNPKQIISYVSNPISYRFCKLHKPTTTKKSLR